MSQRMALALAGALTAFVIVVMIGVMLTVGLNTYAQKQVNAESLPPTSGPSNVSATQAQTQITADQAAQVANRLIPGASLARTPELVNYQGTLAFQVITNRGTVYVDANTAQVIASNLIQTAPARTNNSRQSNEHDGAQHD